MTNSYNQNSLIWVQKGRCEETHTWGDDGSPSCLLDSVEAELWGQKTPEKFLHPPKQPLQWFINLI